MARVLQTGRAMTLKFHMTPGSCTTGIHILLEELELPFVVTIVNLQAGDHRKPAYLAINPKGTIPTLVLDDVAALTSFPSIAYWLARRYPRKRLLSDDPFLAARTLELLDYAVNTVHGQGFTRIFTTDRYLPEGLDTADKARWTAAITAEGQRIVREAFDVIEIRLTETGYAMDADFTIADAALFYVFFWASKTDIEMPPRCQALFERIRARPVVHQVLREEGYR
ncbi:glutathione S-transferase family protein [Hydrogenophaga sp. A37]|uniref:glutathione S-transferase family protein n=1 Tax=Hydrogenophaga sp. A37 TaxID=1945864 RepID=UPI00209ADFB1|nr:glutathione S-transferase N-terminal domain-containing protein [Hydrogenophaga sp. A37]